MGQNCKHSKGASVGAYSLLVGLVAVVALVAIDDIGKNMVDLFTSVSTATEDAVTAGPASPSPSASPVYHASCKAARDAGVTSDGIQTIDPDGSGGIAPFDAWCDMSNDGGGWTLVMRAKGAESGVEGGPWLTASAYGAFSTPAPSGDTFKYSDTVINLLQDDALIRLDADGLYTYTRYVSGCAYSHTSTTRGGPCNVTYPTVAVNPGDAHGNPNPGTMPLTYTFGVSDWPGAHNSYFITSNDYTAEGDNKTWWLELGPAGSTSGTGTDRRCTGLYADCNFTMWVR